MMDGLFLDRSFVLVTTVLLLTGPRWNLLLSRIEEAPKIFRNKETAPLSFTHQALEHSFDAE